MHGQTFSLDIQHSLLPADELKRTRAALRARLAELRAVAGGKIAGDSSDSLQLPTDQSLRAAVGRLIKKYRTAALRYVMVVGIGGSNLGSQAISEALTGLPAWPGQTDPQMVFADTVEPALLARIKTLLAQLTSPDQVVLVLISKSGTTTETVANAAVLVDALQERWPSGPHPIIVVSDEGSTLWELAGKQNWSRLAVPQSVGGRYSVFSSVGLVPLGLLGVDIQQLHAGAADLRDRCLEDSDHNPALQSAAAIYAAYKSGKNIHDTFVFRPQLKATGEWYRQLLAESVGKELDSAGNRVAIGITPTVSVGSTDLHSVGQLALAGPGDKVTTFIWAPPAERVVIPDQPLARLVDQLAEKSAGQILEAILMGTQAAYAKRHRPFLTLTLGSLSAYTLGAWLQWKMIEVMLLATLLRVNPFDQPAVEEYKTHTRQRLHNE